MMCLICNINSVTGFTRQKSGKVILLEEHRIGGRGMGGIGGVAFSQAHYQAVKTGMDIYLLNL